MDQTGLSGVDGLEVDVANLYREESITDMKAATIRQLIPINVDGSEDTSRSRQFIGDTTLMTQMGPIPVQFPLEAETLAERRFWFDKHFEGAVPPLADALVEELDREILEGCGAIADPGASVEAFRDYYEAHHVPLVTKPPAWP